MKRLVKLTAALLALVLLLTALPLSALASTPDPVVPKTTVNVTAKCYNATLTTATATYATKTLQGESVTVDFLTFGYFITHEGKIYEVRTIEYNSIKNSSFVFDDGGTHNVTVKYVPHSHIYTPRHDRIRHWDGCDCGAKLNVAYHVDPATDEDSICTCGYKFSNNADLVTLWLAHMALEPRFNRDITEYNANIHTHKPVTSTEVRVRTLDALATVEMPTDLSIGDDINVFQVTVTAEDRKTTKTYTVYAFLPAKVDGMTITSTKANGEALTLTAPKAAAKKRVASVMLTEAIAQTMADQAKQNESTQVVLAPTFSKWANDSLVVTFPAAALKALSESKADFVIRTWQGNVTIPNGELASLSGQGESIALTVLFKDGPLKCTATADGKDIDSSKITCE